MDGSLLIFFFFCIINKKKFILTCWIENATTTVQDTYHAKLPLKFYRLLYCRCHIHIGSCHDFLPLTRHLLGKSRLTEKYKFPRCSYDIKVVFKVHSLCNDDISVKIWRQQLVNLVDENLFIMQNEGELSNDINQFKSHIIKIRWRSDSEWRLLGSYLYFSCCGGRVAWWCRGYAAASYFLGSGTVCGITPACSHVGVLWCPPKIPNHSHWKCLGLFLFEQHFWLGE